MTEIVIIGLVVLGLASTGFAVLTPTLKWWWYSGFSCSAIDKEKISRFLRFHMNRWEENAKIVGQSDESNLTSRIATLKEIRNEVSQTPWPGLFHSKNVH